MNRNFKLILEYDGGFFNGWQRQKGETTVQGELEITLRQIFNQEIRLIGSGRTDSGVHALGQVANFHARTHMVPHAVKKALNSMIRKPIAIRECCVVEDGFHAQYDAISKEYHYFILNREDPCAIGAAYQWHIKQPLDVTAMKQCCQTIQGVFDFSSFENTGSPRKSTIREIFFSDMIELDDSRLVFQICASGFLKNMVRNLMGTIVLAGLKKITVYDFKTMLDLKDRKKAGPTAPPHGLFLKQVNYSGDQIKKP